MAHFWKYKINDVGRVLDEANRTRLEDGQFKINKLRDGHIKGDSADNLVFRSQDFQTRFDQLKKGRFIEEDILTDGKVTTHATKVLGGIVITLPEEYKGRSREDQDAFFTQCDRLLTEKFGTENCIFSGVHYDETSPHLHYYWTPSVHREERTTKTGRVREGGDYLDAKTVMSHEVLSSFHEELDQHLKKNLSWYKGGVKLPPEKKTPDALTVKDFQEVSDKIKDAKQELAEVNSDVSRAMQRQREVEAVTISEEDYKRMMEGKRPRDPKASWKAVAVILKRDEESRKTASEATLKKVEAERLEEQAEKVARDALQRSKEADRRELAVSRRESGLKQKEDALEARYKAREDSLRMQQEKLAAKDASLSSFATKLEEKADELNQREKKIERLEDFMGKVYTFCKNMIWKFGDEVKRSLGFKDVKMDLMLFDRDVLKTAGQDNRGVILEDDTQAKENKDRGKTYQEWKAGRKVDKSQGLSL